MFLSTFVSKTSFLSNKSLSVPNALVRGKKTITKKFILLLSILSVCTISRAQDTTVYKLRLQSPVLDVPQNFNPASRFPSMNQSLEWSNDLYEAGFWGIDELGDKLFKPKDKPYSKFRKFSNNLFKYAVSLGFSKYGSELPIPLGVWGHEEFHRSVLAVNDISAKNGNWMLNRWDGTVYGVTDSLLTKLKANNVNELLYSYVAGVQYEVALNQKTSINDFYKKRSLAKNALLLYNAYYVYNYFSFSTSAFTDTVKKLAPPHENKISAERDFAGADLTAWAYDMFNPTTPFTTRDSFPNGEGVNRRVGFSDLSPEAQSFLVEQKKLSLLNFLNPAIFFVNRININRNFSFNFFTQYSPTHFGNAISVYVPFKYKKINALFNIHNYNNKSVSGYGVGVGLYHLPFTKKIETDITLNVWDQPESFLDTKKSIGRLVTIKASYFFNKNWSAFVSATKKSKGWVIGNPYLNDNVSFQTGFAFNLVKQ